MNQPSLRDEYDQLKGFPAFKGRAKFKPTSLVEDHQRLSNQKAASIPVSGNF